MRRPALQIIRALRELGADVVYHDPHVPALAEFGLDSADLDTEVAAADLVAVRHRTPRGRLPEAGLGSAQLTIDFRGVTRGIEAENLVRL